MNHPANTLIREILKKPKQYVSIITAARTIEKEVQIHQAKNLIIKSPLRLEIEPALNHLLKKIAKHGLSNYLTKDTDIYTDFVYPLNRALVAAGNS